MSCTSPLTVASTRRPFDVCPSTLLHERLQVGHGHLHRLGRLQHERQLHLARAEQLADGAHPVEEDVVDEVERRSSRRPAPSSRSATRPSRSPSMMRDLRRSLDRPAAAVLLLGGDVLHVGEHLEQAGQRVVARRPPVVHHVEGGSALLLGDAVEGHDAGGVDDGGVQARLHALVQEHRVEDVAGRRRQAERDVGHAEHGVGAGDLRLDAPDRLDGGQAVAPEVVVARRQREGEGVEDEVRGRQPVALGGDLVDAVGHLHLPLDVARLAPLVDEEADDGGAVARGPARRRGPCGCPAARRPRGWPS